MKPWPSVHRSRSLLSLLFLLALPGTPDSTAAFESPGRRPADSLAWRQELYSDLAGKGSVRLLVDYADTRWLLLSRFILLPPQPTSSPFTELHPPRRLPAPISAATFEELVAGRGALVGFSSPYLLFGPIDPVGGVSTVNRPRETGAFSAVWDQRSGGELSVSRDAAALLGVAGRLGPLELHHWRGEDLQRSLGLLSFWDAEGEGLTGELLLTESRLTSAPAYGGEPWFFDQPPVLSTAAYHAAVRSRYTRSRLKALALLSLSATPLDPPGAAVVSVTRLGRLGGSVGLLTAGYLDGELSSPRPGITATVGVRRQERLGHALGGSASAELDGALGAPPTAAQREGGLLSRSLGYPRLSGLEADLRWRWRRRPSGENPSLPRELQSDLALELERKTVEQSWEIAAPWTPAFRWVGRGRSLSLALPTAVALVGKQPEASIDRGVREISAGVEGRARVPGGSVEAAWSLTIENGRALEERMRFAVELRLGRERSVRVGGRIAGSGEAGGSREELLRNLEGALYLRINGERTAREPAPEE